MDYAGYFDAIDFVTRDGMNYISCSMMENYRGTGAISQSHVWNFSILSGFIKILSIAFSGLHAENIQLMELAHMS